ncbi:MAG: hypothetical protein ACFCUN_09185 [Hyphomicrobiaceae bacterium]
MPEVSPPHLAGLALLAAAALLVGAIALRRQPRAIRLFALALLVVALGYAATTNIPVDVVRSVFGEQY